MHVTIHPFFEPSSGSYCFVVADAASLQCAIIDPALGMPALDSMEPANTHCADLVMDWVEAHGYDVAWILDTHIHADRPGATGYLRSRLPGAKTGIGAKVRNVQGYDCLLKEGDELVVGQTVGRVLETPGHTPGCLSYQFGNALFVGDTLFMPDTGTARCDFPGGSAETLYASIQRILSYPPNTRLYVCHDYGGEGRRFRFVTTVAEERDKNIHVGHNAACDEFVRMRRERDAQLNEPKWAAVAIPANLKCMALDDVDALLTARGANEGQSAV